PGYVSCIGGIHAGSLVKDRHGVYILQSDGNLERQTEADAAMFLEFPEKRWEALRRALNDKNLLYYY
ncbi:MAG: hypothetical protein ACRCWR_03435, partial [Saezia sp.]